MIIANDQCLDGGTVFFKGHGDRHRASKAFLRHGDSAFNFGRNFHRFFSRLLFFLSAALSFIDGIQHCFGGDGGTADGFDIFYLQGGFLTDELIDKQGFLGG